MENTINIFISKADLLNNNIFQIDSIDLRRYNYLCKCGLLPTYINNGEEFHLASDIASIINVINAKQSDIYTSNTKNTLFDIDNMSTLRVGANTIIDSIYDENVVETTFYSAVRNLIVHCNSYEHNNGIEISMPYFAGTNLITYSENVAEYAKEQLIRCKKTDVADKSQFARSAYYMGSKSSLCGYVVEAVSSCIKSSGTVVDLMCGSGVMSGAFNKIWKTYSSDAQQFCRILASVHGGGFSRNNAQELLTYLLPIAKSHFIDIQANISAELEIEDNLFCHDIDDELVRKYNTFIATTPTYVNNVHTDLWNPNLEISIRKSKPDLYPYCLFTAYFTNSYFGLRQCAEIDSIRYAIDQVADEKQKQWALGALISTLSALGTTYGGHFAQPGVVNYGNLSLNKLSSIINKRSFSVTHEFAIRLLNLTDNNSCCIEDITIVPGPWANALEKLDGYIDKNTLVYVDAPYTREEYSRYYHVLETLVAYNYPSCEGKGLTPLPHERFKTEFFTRTESKIIDAYVSVITTILKKGCSCALSHSNSATVSTYDIINSINKSINCDVMSYSAPYTHRSQGGAKHKTVVEYLVIFKPINNTTM